MNFQHFKGNSFAFNPILKDSVTVTKTPLWWLKDLVALAEQGFWCCVLEKSVDSGVSSIPISSYFLDFFLGETLRWSQEKYSNFASEKSTLTRLRLRAEPGVSFRLSLGLWQARLILWEGFSHAPTVPIMPTKFSFIGWIISDATRTPLKKWPTSLIWF